MVVSGTKRTMPFEVSQVGRQGSKVILPAAMIGIILMLSLITAFKYGRSWVLANVTVSSRDGKAVSISEINSFNLSWLLRRSKSVNVAVRLVVSLPATLAND